MDKSFTKNTKDNAKGSLALLIKGVIDIYQQTSAILRAVLEKLKLSDRSIKQFTWYI